MHRRLLERPGRLRAGPGRKRRAARVRPAPLGHRLGGSGGEGGALFASRTISAIAPQDPLTSLADHELLSLAERGDGQAFEVLYDRHARVAYSLALRLLGDRQLAEDLVQDSFLAVWRRAGSYAPSRGGVRSWMLSILHNQGIDRLRALGAVSRRQSVLELEERLRPEEPDAAAQGIERALAGGTRDALARLPAEQREVLGLAYYGGFTHSEIAEMLSLPLGTVKGRMRLGVNRLRQMVGAEIA